MNFEKAYDLITDKLTDWSQDLIKLLPNFVLATLIMVLGTFIAKSLKNLFKNLLEKFIKNKTIENLSSSIIYIFLLGIVVFTALSVLKLDKAVTSILAGAGIIGLALAFAFQDIAANFMSGIFISLRKPLNVGDIVNIKSYMGRVEEINLRDTVIRTYQGQMVIIPNKDVFQNPIENYALLGKRRIDIKVGISYAEDLDEVLKITKKAVKDIDGLAKDEEITMFYTEFGDSAINYVIRVWIAGCEQLKFLEVQSQCIINIHKAYHAHNIVIPFPIRTLDFGIKGGAPLSEMYPLK